MQSKSTLIAITGILIALVAAWTLTWRRLQIAESQLSEVGLHQVRIRCVDVVSGSVLVPKVIGVPAPHGEVIAMEQLGEVIVFWSGRKSDGDNLGAWAVGYKPTILPPNWSEESLVELQLLRQESEAEQAAPSNR